MKDRRFIYLVISCAACVALWLLIPYLPVPKNTYVFAAVGLAMLSVFMFIQMSIPRWFTSLTVKPVWAVLVVVVAIVGWLAVVMVVSSPYARYEVKGYGSIPLKIGEDVPENLPATIQKEFPMPQTEQKKEPGKENENKDGKNLKTASDNPPKMMKVTLIRRPANLSFKLFVFSNVAQKSKVITSLLMIIAASAFGYLVSYILREPNILLPVSILAAGIDIWTVKWGPTFQAIQKIPHVVESVSVAIPKIGGAAAGFQAVSFIGPADFIFFAMFLGAIYRLKMNPVRTFWVAFPLLTLGMASVIASGMFPALKFLHGGLPALILIGASVVIGNLGHFKLKKDEYIAIAVVAVLLAAVIFVLTPIIRSGS